MAETTKRERPILFSPPMVRAILAGRKTQTRRVVKLPKWAANDIHLDQWGLASVLDGKLNADAWVRCPFADIRPIGISASTMGLMMRYQPGDRLWVKEGFRYDADKGECYYVADGEEMGVGAYLALRDKHPNACRAIFMRREWSRITLEVTEVRVERVQDISTEDCIAEGVIPPPDYPQQGYELPGQEGRFFISAQQAFAELWDSINGDKHPWSSNPWVWVVSFQKVEVNDA